MSEYWGELRANWRPLLAATIGLGTGMSLIGIVISTMAPALIGSNGWSKADFAMVGTLGLFSSLALPFVGRLADVLGVRRTALIGQVAMPLTYLAYSRMDGTIGVYIAIFIAQSIICMTTTATVYARLAVQYVRKSRGLALAIVASGPALFGIVVGPLLNGLVEAEGWRSGYQALAIFAVVAGVVTYLLIPAEAAGPDAASAPPKRRAREDYPAIFRNAAFWILAAAMLLCNLPQTILQAQLKMLMLENGVDGRAVGAMLSAASLGMLSGRILTGLAIDRFNPYVVGFITMGLPSLGLFLISSDLDAPALAVGRGLFPRLHLRRGGRCGGLSGGAAVRGEHLQLGDGIADRLHVSLDRAGRQPAQRHAGRHRQLQPVPGDRRHRGGDRLGAAAAARPERAGPGGGKLDPYPGPLPRVHFLRFLRAA